MKKFYFILFLVLVSSFVSFGQSYLATKELKVYGPVSGSSKTYSLDSCNIVNGQLTTYLKGVVSTYEGRYSIKKNLIFHIAKDSLKTRRRRDIIEYLQTSKDSLAVQKDSYSHNINSFSDFGNEIRWEIRSEKIYSSCKYTISGAYFIEALGRDITSTVNKPVVISSYKKLSRSPKLLSKYLTQ